MNDNVETHPVFRNQSIVRELKDIKATALIIVAATEDDELIVLNKLDNPFTAVGMLHKAMSIVMYGEEEDD